LSAEAIPAALLETLELLESLERSERIEALISIADRFSEVPERIARRPFPEERRVPGCESEAYLWALPRDDGGLELHFAVENPQGISAKAFAVILGETLDGVAPERIVAIPSSVVERVFGPELSMGKSLGLTGMLNSVQREARRRLVHDTA